MNHELEAVYIQSIDGKIKIIVFRENFVVKTKAKLKLKESFWAIASFYVTLNVFSAHKCYNFIDISLPNIGILNFVRW